MRVLHPTDSEPKTQRSSVPNSSWRGEPTRDLGTEHCSVFEIVSEKMEAGGIEHEQEGDDGKPDDKESTS